MALPSLETPAEAAPARKSGAVLAVARALTLVLSVLLVAAAQVSFNNTWRQYNGWWLALAAIVVTVSWQYRLAIIDWTQSGGRLWGLAPQRWRRALGLLVVAAGIGLWADATRRLSANWDAYFDRAWLSWVAAVPIMSVGFRVLQTPRTPGRNRLSRWEWMVLAAAFAVAAAFRLANLQNYPPNDGVSQVEELQQGEWAIQFFGGWRGRWEFLGQMWVAALGIQLGGPTLLAVRTTMSALSLLKVLPVYFWFRALGGPAGAMVGTALFATSGWDTIVSRIGGHQDTLVIVCCLALLTGPAVRGAWAAYPWVGLLAGYEIYSYIGYRPLIGFAIAGAFIAGCARAPAERRLPRVRDLAPAVFVTCLLVGMFLPLTYRLAGEGRFMHEYFNGWNRAHAIEEYYGHDDSWAMALHKRWERAALAAGLFYTAGDGNPTHNAGGRPMVDPVTGSLMLFGIGYGLVAVLRGFYGLMLAAFAVVFTGTLVATGNFDVLRAGAIIPYAYALAAIGAGSLATGAARRLGRIGHVMMGLALAGGVLWAGYWNGRLLHDLWTSRLTRQHYHSDLAYLSTWLGQNARGKRVIGLIPSSASVVFFENDGSWLRGPEVKGEATWDIGATLSKLSREHGETLLLTTSGPTQDLAEYFQFLWPSVQLQPRYDDNGGLRMAYALLQDPAALLQSEQVRRVLCTGVRAHFQLRRANSDVIAAFDELVPFVESSTWPGALREAAFRHEQDARWIDAAWEGEFTIAEAGQYSFFPESYEGATRLIVDGTTTIPGGNQTPVQLDAGPHHFEMKGRFNARMTEPSARLSWMGPPTGTTFKVVPFYRLAPTDQECLDKTSGAAPAPQAVTQPTE